MRSWKDNGSGGWEDTSSGFPCLLLGGKKAPFILKGRGKFWELFHPCQSGKGYDFEGIAILSFSFIKCKMRLITDTHFTEFCECQMNEWETTL